MKKFRIVGFTQIYNEIRKDNLQRFVKYFSPLIDEWVIYDDGSTDGSYEYVSSFTPYIIRSSKNQFINEIEHRSQLFELALRLNPDFVLWLDVDEVLTSSLDKSGLQKLCQKCIDNGCDGVSLHEWNIWRSNSWRRIDNLYDDGWFVRLWRIVPGIEFSRNISGLHQQGFPLTIRKIYRSTYGAVLHYGFASEKNLAFKYLVYRSNGQAGLLLKRLIDEENLSLIKIPSNNFPTGLAMNKENAPQPLTFKDSLVNVEKFREEIFKPRISIICLIYKSTDWLQFIYSQVLKWIDLDQNEFFFVANDANDDVLNYLKDHYIPHFIFNNTTEQKKEWYINNVYRAFNYGAKVARGDYLLFLNSDMAFSPHWLDNLFIALNADNCIVPRLVESGKMPSGKYGISKNFGRTFDQYEEKKFIEYVNNVAHPRIEDGGLYMPLLIRNTDFWSVGGYPEGNITENSNIFEPQIAIKDQVCISGDEVLMKKLASIGIKHQTSFDSIIYHFQAGEMDSINQENKNNEFFPIVICNDLLTGSMGERTMWDFLIENLPNVKGVDSRTLGSLKDFSHNAYKYIHKNYPNTQIVIQNASFIDLIYPESFTCVYLQDDLRRMGNPSPQQEINLKKADLIVSNSRFTASSYPEYDIQIIPIGIDDKIFCPMDKSSMRHKHNINFPKVGIFVGEFSEVKGWSKIAPLIYSRQDIYWILVSKKEENFTANNARVYNRIDQFLLAELLNCANFFIIASPVETQCLAAIEACFCNIPIVIKKVGIFADWSDEDCAAVGVFGDNFENNIDYAINGEFRPRDIMFQKGLTIEHMIQSWSKLISQTNLLVDNRINLHQDSQSVISKQGYSVLQKRLGFMKFFTNEIRYLLVHKIWGRYIKNKTFSLVKRLTQKVFGKKIYTYLKELLS